MLLSQFIPSSPSPLCPQVRSLYLHLHLSVTLQGLCRWKLRSQISWSKLPWCSWSNQVSPLSLSLEFWSREVRENYCERGIQHEGRVSIAGSSYGRRHGARVMVDLWKLREHPHWQPAKKGVLQPTTKRNEFLQEVLAWKHTLNAKLEPEPWARPWHQQVRPSAHQRIQSYHVWTSDLWKLWVDKVIYGKLLSLY